jgi:hypothetical protein
MISMRETRILMLAGVAGTIAVVPARAAPERVMPPMSTATVHYFATHADAYAQFLKQLGSPDRGDTANAPPRTVKRTGGAWQVVASAPAGGLCNPLLLTDGSVMVASCDTPNWYRLTADITGNYAKGTWTQLASLPIINGTQYAPLYHASGVLADGRVVVMGGEYNGSNTEVWTNLGAIYDPLADTWTPVNPPLGTSWTNIGDAESVVLPDGTFMLASCCAYHPDVDALFNPKSLTWTEVPGPRFGGQYQDEQGYELLPDGNVLTIDIWTAYIKNLPASINTELYKPAFRRWYPGKNTPVSLPDSDACGTFEIGPAVLRGDATVVAFGGHTGCSGDPLPQDPTAILNTKLNSWSIGPSVPAVCGADGTVACTLADAPAAAMPDGNILFAASSGFGQAPTHFFEVGADNSITQVSDPLLHSTMQGAFTYFFLDLPNGQVLMSDFSRKLEVYTPSGTAISSWAPVIASVPANEKAGGTFRLIGTQLNGRTQGAAYGDDAQMATNYPIVRLTNTSTGHVFYARTSRFSTYSVAANIAGSADFTLPANIESGSFTLVAAASGNASAPVLVTVK